MTARTLLSCLSATCLLGLLAGPAGAVQPLGDAFRVSNQAPDGDLNFDATVPAVAHNTTTGEYLVVWQGETDTDGETEIYGRLVSAAGGNIGNPFRLSDMGPDGDTGFDAQDPDVAYNPTTNEYLVTWYGDDDTGPFVGGEEEIYIQRVSATGAEIGTDTRISDMGPNGDTSYDARNPAVAYNSTADAFIVAWSGDDDSGGLADGEFEIYVQRIDADGTELGVDNRISDMGSDGDSAFSALNPDVTYNPSANQYFVVWDGDDNTAPQVNGESEIFFQRLSAIGVELGADTRISEIGPSADTDYDAFRPRVDYNSAADEYLVVWFADDNTGSLVEDEFETYLQRVDSAGGEVGDDTRISQMGTDGNTMYGAVVPDVAYNSAQNEYLVTWYGGTEPFVFEELEVYGQRLDTTAATIDGNTRLSYMGTDGVATATAVLPAVAANPAANEYLVAWAGSEDAAPLVSGEFEIYARRINGTNTAPASGNCATGPEFNTSDSDNDITLSVAQLKINQRIGAAAVRRANGIEDWLGGIVGTDLCGGTLGPADLDSGVAITTDALNASAGVATPRSITIPAAQDKGDVEFTLTTSQLRINQRIYSAAVRRANALKARIEGKLTGGDLADGTVTVDKLRQDVTVLSRTAAASPAPASTTEIESSDDSNATFTLTAQQLKINQRIAAAAVRRVNELRTLLGSGLTSGHFADGSISAVDLAS